VLGQSQSQPKPALQPMVAPQAEDTRGPESSGSLSGAGKIGFGIGGLFLLGMIGAGVIAFSKPDSSAPPPAAVEQAKIVVPNVDHGKLLSLLFMRLNQRGLVRQSRERP
jgi:hypothetical protein